MRPGRGSVPARSLSFLVGCWPTRSGQRGKNRSGVGVLGHERGHQLGRLITRELRGWSRSGAGSFSSAIRS